MLAKALTAAPAAAIRRDLASLPFARLLNAGIFLSAGKWTRIEAIRRDAGAAGHALMTVVL